MTITSLDFIFFIPTSESIKVGNGVKNIITDQKDKAFVCLVNEFEPPYTYVIVISLGVIFCLNKEIACHIAPNKWFGSAPALLLEGTPQNCNLGWCCSGAERLYILVIISDGTLLNSE